MVNVQIFLVWTLLDIGTTSKTCLKSPSKSVTFPLIGTVLNKGSVDFIVSRSKQSIEFTAAARIIDTSSIRIIDASCRSVALSDVALMEETEEGNTGTGRPNNLCKM